MTFFLFSKIHQITVITVCFFSQMKVLGGNGVIVAKHVHILGGEVNIGVYFHSRNTGCALIQQLICY